MPGYTLTDGVTLKNKFGAASPDALDKLETEPVRHRIFQLELGYALKGRFDAEHLKAIHRHIFQDVFEWAGHTRDERVLLSDGEIATEINFRKADSAPFLSGIAIPAALDKISQEIRAADYLRGLPREQFAQQAADIMAELNATHPFRDGNGRTQRAFMRQLANEAGHNLDFSVVSKERMIQASIAANEQGDISMMHRMFFEISDPERVALLREGIEKLQDAFDREAQRTGKEALKWNDRYVATVTQGHPIELVLAGVAGDQFMARTNDQILFGKAADLPEPRPQRGETFRINDSASPSHKEHKDAPHKTKTD